MAPKALSILILGIASSNASADVIFSNNSSSFDPDLNYPLKHSEIIISNDDKILVQDSESNIGKLEFKKPHIDLKSNENYDRELYGKVHNKFLSDKLSLTIYKDQDTGKILKVESQTIPLKEYLTKLGIEIIKIIKILAPLVLPVVPEEPNMHFVLSEEDKQLNDEQCIKYQQSIKIKVPTDLPRNGKSFEIEGDNGKKCIAITYKPISSYTLPFNSLNGVNVGNNLLSSTCREVNITIKQAEGREYTFSTTVADSSFLQRSSIPANGTLRPSDCTWNLDR